MIKPEKFLKTDKKLLPFHPAVGAGSSLAGRGVSPIFSTTGVNPPPLAMPDYNCIIVLILPCITYEHNPYSHGYS